MPRKATGGKVGKPPFQPSDEDRAAVEMMAAQGVNQESIARVIGGGIDVDTLVKYFREELDTSAIKANAKIGGTAFNKALAGDAQMIRYWMNCRAGWKESHDVNLSGNVNITHIERRIVDPTDPDS